MFKYLKAFWIAALATALFLAGDVHAARLKDIANVRGVRENQLIGYGLVVGLNGTGDGKGEFTSKSFVRMLDTIGMKLENKDIESKNVAAVIITATLPPFARAGNKLDISVNSIGSASSLQGGTLIQTPLRAADQQVYAVAQGSLLIGGGGGGGAGGGGEKAHPTAGRIPNGAIIETDLPGDFSNKKVIRLTLFEGDFTTAARVVKTVNQDLGGKYASAKDASTIDVIVPFSFEGNAVELLASIESLEINNDSRARVIVNEKTGTVVIGERVQIGTVAISHGSISVQVKGTSSAGDAAGQNGDKSKGEKVAILKKGTNVGDLVKTLNTLGVGPKDLITILQSIKAAGALPAELEVL